MLGTPDVGGLGEKGEKYPRSPRAERPMQTVASKRSCAQTE